MLDTKRPAKAVVAAMAQQKVIIGRVWPIMPNWTRITVGTQDEMTRFQAAFKQVMDGAVATHPASPRRKRLEHIDGRIVPA
jgi:histidinol-phosphate aminotransferase